jgi:uncharacterized protein
MTRTCFRCLSTMKKSFVLEYHFVDNMLERRTPHRAAHLKYAQDAVDNNILIAGGALVPDVKRGLLIFCAADPTMVDNFARNDPYVVEGLVTDYKISEWAIAVGKLQ